MSTELKFKAMGSECSIVGVEASEAVMARAILRIAELEKLWSRFEPQSEISQINSSDSEPVLVSPETLEVLETCLAAWRLSGGAFDPTIGRHLVDAGYDRPIENIRKDPKLGERKPQTVPNNAVANQTDVSKIELDPKMMTVSTPKGMTLDVGGVAKGYTADLIAEQLMGEGVAGCCVNIGGDVRVCGKAPNDKEWTIELTALKTDENIIEIESGAVCTSTTTLRRWGENLTENHLRDPDSGLAIGGNIASVIIIGANATQCEVLTKMAFVSGESGLEKLFENHNVAGAWIDKDETHYLLGEFQKFLPD